MSDADVGLTCIAAVGIVGTGIVWSVVRGRRMRARALEAQHTTALIQARHLAEYDARFQQLLSAMNASRGRDFRFDGIERRYNPKTNETIYWAGDASLEYMPGFLVVTEARVHFTSLAGEVVSKTWRAIASWRIEGQNTVRIIFTSGKPMLIQLPDPLASGPIYDARTVATAMGFARDAS